jgi:hypothetical protein
LLCWYASIRSRVDVLVLTVINTSTHNTSNTSAQTRTTHDD